MRKVAASRFHAIEPGNHWDKGFADLLLEAAAPAAKAVAIDAIFCASNDRHQADPAAIVADRLGLKPQLALSLDCADISSAAALYVAWQHVRAGFCKHALVVGAAKVSDISEAQRLALMDASLDRDADVARGIDFAAQAGLLAGHYCRAREKDVSIFAETTAANLAAWANHSKHHAPTAAEVRRDLLVAPPLVRSDFAQLLDGAAALVLSDIEDAGQPCIAIDAIASGTDNVSVWERKDPLAFDAVRAAVSGLADSADNMNWLEIDAAVSVAQILSEEALGRGNAKQSQTNRRGGAQGRGRVPGVSTLYQLTDICELAVRGETALLLAVAGLGSHVFGVRLSGIS